MLPITNNTSLTKTMNTEVEASSHKVPGFWFLSLPQNPKPQNPKPENPHYILFQLARILRIVNSISSVSSTYSTTASSGGPISPTGQQPNSSPQSAAASVSIGSK
jgi:hypothetical protein